MEEKAASLTHQFGYASLGKRVDISAGEAVQSAMRETEAALGSISHLVHAAAMGSGKFGFPFTNLEPGDWPRVLDVNIMGMVHVAHAVTPGMVARRAGTMVFIASVAGQIGSQTDPPYSASKAANINFAQCLAKDLAPHNVRVNVVNPGMVKTPLNRRVWQGWNDQQPPGSQAFVRGVGRRKGAYGRAARPLAGSRGRGGDGGIPLVGPCIASDRADHQCRRRSGHALVDRFRSCAHSLVSPTR